MVKSDTVKGFQDFVGAEALKRAKIVKIIREQFELYGFEPAETPTIEFEEFVRGDNAEDEAVRDVFKLEDRGKRKLALRYEFTFQLKRISKNQKLPYKRFQIGVVFRDEPIREGRSRQFIQCDVDTVGSTIKDEAEILAVVDGIFKKLGMSVKTYINNRKLINEILVAENIAEKDREQAIRELDKLDKLPPEEVKNNLKKIGAEKLLKIFMGKEKDFVKYNYYKEIKELKKYCKGYGVQVEFRPFLARGLSYYTSSVFETWSKELNVSLAGGGSYLVDNVQASGIAFGFEPIYLLSKIEGDRTEVQIISMGQDKEAIELAKKLREKGTSVNLIMDKAVGKALDYANSKGVEKVVFVGAEEVKKGKFKIKDMKSGKEELLASSTLISQTFKSSKGCI
jgi:histidyl-tRNA synthetase